MWKSTNSKLSFQLKLNTTVAYPHKITRPVLRLGSFCLCVRGEKYSERQFSSVKSECVEINVKLFIIIANQSI